MTARVVARFDAAPGTQPEAVLRGELEMVAVAAHGRPVSIAAPDLDAQTLTELSLAAARG